MEKNKEALKSLLNRKPPENYIEELSEIYSEKIEISDNQLLTSFFVFRLQDEWFGLLAETIKEVVDLKKVHKIPHKSHDILLGTVNISGQFKLLVSLEKILDLSLSIEKKDPYKKEQLIVFSQDQREWVIKVSEIIGIKRFNLNNIKNVPITLTKSINNYLKGIIRSENKDIGLIDEELLFYSLNRSLL